MFSTAAKVFIWCFLGIILGGVTALDHALVHRFEVRRSSHTRLCTNNSILTVNGQFPGPTIYARKGDVLIVDVINRADQNITIHWHGVKMPRYPWTDGTDFVTQCPITPGKRFRQRIILSDEEGTLWWHAHIDWTRASVYGAIIILPPKGETYPFPKPHAEVPILLGEWWNGDVQQVFEDFLAGGRGAKVCDAFLINGQPGDMYPCSRQDTFKLKVEAGKTYLFRMINAMMDYIMYVKIAKHNLTVVATDAAYTKPMNTEHIALSPGQTIDFLLEANQPLGRYYMVARVYATSGAEYVPTTGIIDYVGGGGGNYTPPLLPTFPEFSGYAQSAHFTNRLTSLASEKHPIHVPVNITENLFFVLAINEWPCLQDSCLEPERLMASMNNISMVMPEANILEAYYRGINGVFTPNFPKHPSKQFNFMGNMRSNWSRPKFGTAVYMLEYNSEVEIVLQATNFYGIDHPMHLHGYSFYVLGSGFGNFDPATDRPTLNLVDPPLMNTIAVPRDGWSVIRFKANNPGVWYFHCHFERHQSWGMKMVFIVMDGKAPNEKMLPPPPDMPRCDAPPLNLLFRI